MPYRQKGGYFDRDGEVRKLAAGIAERVRQLTAGNPSFSERDLIDPMVGFLPSLHQIWTTTSDDTLANLCSEFPAFYRYAKVMEDAFEEERRRGGAGQTGPDMVPLPESVRPSVARLMSEAATLVSFRQACVTFGILCGLTV
jgi:hypothetical protein